jgi:hypothetical protein
MEDSCEYFESAFWGGGAADKEWSSNLWVNS